MANTNTQHCADVDQPARRADPAEYKCWQSSDEYGRATGIRTVNRSGSYSIRGGGLKRLTNGKVKSTKRVQALETQTRALDMAFLLHGSYAPRDLKEAAQYGVKIIRVEIPRPLNEYNQFIDVIPESALSRHRPTSGAKPSVPENGKPPTDKNGNDWGIFAQ